MKHSERTRWKQLTLLLSIVATIPGLYAQSYNVSGVVRDAVTKEPLVAANVLVVGTRIGTVTNDHGRFAVSLTAGQYQIQCSYVGYKTAVVDFTLERDVELSLELHSLDILLQDMTVFASQEGNGTSQEEVSMLSLQSETITKITSLMPDVLRSVQMLPGVSNDNEMSAKFNVHGGDVNENLVLINGTQVYEPYHVKEAQNASIGIFDVAMMKKMDLMTGGFTARYGDRMSSVLSIEYREGDNNRMRGQASMSLTDGNVLLEGPVGGDGSFIIGARQSYLKYEMQILDVQPGLHISFYDVQGVLSYRLAPQHKLMLKFIHAGDNFGEDPSMDAGNAYTSPFYTSNGKYSGSFAQMWKDTSESHAHYNSSMVALQSLNILSGETVLRSELSYYDQLESEHSWGQNHYEFVFHSSSFTPDVFYRNTTNKVYDNSLRIRTVELNSSCDMQILPFYALKTGASYQRIFYYQDFVFGRTISEFTNNNAYPDTVSSVRNQNFLDNALGSIDAQSYKLSGYIEDIVQVGEKTIINLGGRFDYFDLNKDLTWSPRLNLAHRISPDLTLRVAWGHYEQSPIYQQLRSSIASDTNTQSQRAIHYVLGGDYRIVADGEHRRFLSVKVEAYHKTYSNLISSTLSSSGTITYSRKNDAIGRATGLDLQLICSVPGFSGWISYSLLNAEQRLTQSDTIGAYFPRNTDQRHTLAVVTDFDLGSGWGVNARFVYGSGYLYTPSVAVYNSALSTWTWQSSSPNSAYLPAYRRLDLRGSKDFVLLGMSASAFLDVSNVLNFTNVSGISYGFNNNGYPQTRNVVLYPIIPTLGVAVRF
jgi:hypothetical protein